MDRKTDELRDELKAILAASRELSPEHDDALAEQFVEHLRSQQIPDTTDPVGQGGATGRELSWGNSLVPIAISLGTGTFLSVVAAVMSGASVGEFVLVWIFTTLVMAAVVQIGLMIASSRRRTDRLGK